MAETPSTSKNTGADAENSELELDSESDNSDWVEQKLTLLRLATEHGNMSSDDSDDSSDDDSELNQTIENRHIPQDQFAYDFDLDDFDEIDDEEFELDVMNERWSNPQPLFSQNSEEFGTCKICYDSVMVRRRICCDTSFCDTCIDEYLEGCITDGIVKIECPGCNFFIYRDEILARLPLELKEKFYKFLIDANKDPYVKTCPRCSHVKKVSKAELDDKVVIKKGLQVTCDKCELIWCFPCHSPWHDLITCKEYRKGDRLVQQWAHEMQCGQVNAQRCPSCKIFIQRTSGCDHMTCSSCKTGFCYRCGKRYRSLKMFGNHFSRYSPFGCKYNLLPNRPGARRLVRGTILGGKVLCSAVLAGLALAAGAVLVGASVVVVPAILGYRYNKRRRARRRMKRHMTPMPYIPSEIMLRPGPEVFENINPLSVDEDGIRDFLSNYDTDGTAGETYPNNWVMLSRLNELQQVEVLVHHRSIGTTASFADSTDNTTQTDSEDTKTDNNVVTVTNVTEEISEEGYTRVVAHITAKNIVASTAEEHSKESSKETDSSEKEGKTDGARKSSKDSIQDVEEAFSDLELTGETNGCFVNIFSKKLNSWQVHNTLPNTHASSKTVLKMKSGTWEKSGKKLSNSTSLDIRTFSNILSSQSEKDVQTCDSADVPECSGSQEDVFKLPCDYVTYL